MKVNDYTIKCGADLRGVNLSQSKGLILASEWLYSNFNTDDRGRLIVYKAFGNTTYNPPMNWKIGDGQIINEVVNPLRTLDCACGINFGTLKWIKGFYENSTIRECYIEPLDFADIVVPYNTTGKARCGKLTIGKIIK